MVALFLVCLMGKALTASWALVLIVQEGIKVRGGLMGLVYQKSLRLSCVGMSETGIGLINNLAANDAEQIVQQTSMIPNLISAPLLFVVSLVLLAMTVGASFLAGFAAMIIV